jgi:hypothetical protein
MTSPIFTNKRIGLIKAMQNNGLTNREIADALGTTEASVRSRLSQLGLSRNPVRVSVGATRVHFSNYVVERCAPHAIRRDISTADLMRLLMDRIAQDDLFEAILDDGK